MKLNRSRPYGTIVGHETARYEQEGLLFDGAGNLISDEPVAPPRGKLALKNKAAPADVNDRQLRNAQDFLRGLLRGGPIDKSVVYKEAENNNQHWDTIKTAFAALKGRAEKRGTATLWALPGE